MQVIPFNKFIIEDVVTVKGHGDTPFMIIRTPSHIGSDSGYHAAALYKQLRIERVAESDMNLLKYGPHDRKFFALNIPELPFTKQYPTWLSLYYHSSLPREIVGTDLRPIRFAHEGYFIKVDYLDQPKNGLRSFWTWHYSVPLVKSRALDEVMPTLLDIRDTERIKRLPYLVGPTETLEERIVSKLDQQSHLCAVSYVPMSRIAVTE